MNRAAVGELITVRDSIRTEFMRSGHVGARGGRCAHAPTWPAGRICSERRTMARWSRWPKRPEVPGTDDGDSMSPALYSEDPSSSRPPPSTSRSGSDGSRSTPTTPRPSDRTERWAGPTRKR